MSETAYQQQAPQPLRLSGEIGEAELAGEISGDVAVMRPAGAVAASDCGCGCGGQKKDCGCGCGGARQATVAQEVPQLVYALGQIGYDFGTEARRDSIRQFMAPGSPMSTPDIIEHLKDPNNIEDVERLIWTLNLDGTPIYALRPAGAFAPETYAKIFTAFDHQVNKREVTRNKRRTMEAVTLVAVPGRIAGSIRLMSGETVPVLVPSGRGIVEWDLDLAIDKALTQYRESREEGVTERQREERAAAMEATLPGFLSDFRNLITRKYRNLGITGRERALNFASTAAFRALEILKKIGGLDLVVDDIVVMKSAACRTASDCYDVQIRVFRPTETTDALRVFQFTLDVSDVIPVSIGELSDWRERPKG